VADPAPTAIPDAELPRDERPDHPSLWPRAGPLPGTASAWALLVAGALLLALAALRAAGVAGGLPGWLSVWLGV
ncbi:MAG: hypothetical protein ACK533_17025, partial [Planctomycetota bacterium]